MADTNTVGEIDDLLAGLPRRDLTAEAADEILDAKQGISQRISHGSTSRARP